MAWVQEAGRQDVARGQSHKETPRSSEGRKDSPVEVEPGQGCGSCHKCAQGFRMFGETWGSRTPPKCAEWHPGSQEACKRLSDQDLSHDKFGEVGSRKKRKPGKPSNPGNPHPMMTGEQRGRAGGRVGGC